MASIKPRRRGESGLKELDAEMQRTFSMKMGQLRRLKKDVLEEDSDSGVVFVSHIPHGFYEPQMKKFFSQFGNIKRLRLSRSKKSGRSKGYAYIEFEFSEVAKVVAETMHNYLMYRKLLKCFYVPKEKLHPETFKGCFRQFKRPRRREIAAARNNSLLESGKEHILEKQRKRVAGLNKKQERLEKLGIDFKIEGLESEWNRLEKSQPPAPKPKTTKSTPVSKATPVAKATGKSPSRGRRQRRRQTARRTGKGGEKTTAANASETTKPASQKTSDAAHPGACDSEAKPKKTKKTVASGGKVVKSPATPARKSIQKSKREAKSAKVISKSKSRKDGGTTVGKKSKRVSL